ncbi:hypothetical protein BpHYR1_043783 [Brachionus plicatilis]|uniref:Uncharacterized protein n=1 Tax=Brachionus plicatilis TaxID=10195 RepID=A0A3M7PQH4_BRAPC|nr:hypothetical protein BpHYR1_043783 [Brachionus plicatilis]
MIRFVHSETKKSPYFIIIISNGICTDDIHWEIFGVCEIGAIASLKPRVYVRPCTKYPTHGIKACVAKQGDTIILAKKKFSNNVKLSQHECFDIVCSNFDVVVGKSVNTLKTLEGAGFELGLSLD